MHKHGPNTLAHHLKEEATNPYRQRSEVAASPFYLDTVGHPGRAKKSEAAGRRDPRQVMQAPPPSAGPRWADGGESPQRAGRGPQPGPPRLRQDEDLRCVIVMGTFRARTRTAVATREAVQVLQLLGLHHEIVEILGGPSTAKVVRIRMKTADGVATAIARARVRPIASDLTISGQVRINRARTQVEAARVTPLSLSLCPCFADTSRGEADVPLRPGMATRS